MSHVLGFLVMLICFGSDLKYRLMELRPADISHRRTRRSVSSDSSPIKVAVHQDADSTAFWQISKSASPSA